MKRTLQALGISVIVAALLGVGYYYEFLHSFEYRAHDYKLKFRGQLEMSKDVVIVVIDDESVKADNLGRWPWPRVRHAQIAQKLNDLGATVVAFDVFFPEPEENVPLGGIIGFFEANFQHLGLDRRASMSRLQQFSELFESAFDALNPDMYFAQVLEASENIILAYFYINPLSSGETYSALNKEEQEEIKSELSRIASSEIQVKRAPGAVDPFPKHGGVTTNIELFSSSASHFGHVTQEPDKDGVNRRSYPIVSHHGRYFPSLNLLAASLHLGKEIKVKLNPKGVPPELRLGDIEIPLDVNGQYLVNFYGLEEHPRYSAINVIYEDVFPEEGPEAAKENFREYYGVDMEDAFRGKTVFIGATAIGIYDLRVTPFSKNYAGVEIRATVTDNFLTSRHIQTPAWSVRYVEVLMVLFALTMGLILAQLGALTGALVTVTIIAVYVIGVDYLYFFRSKGYSLFVVYPAVQLFIQYIFITLFKYATEEKDKREIKGTFGKYLAPSVVEQLTKDPSLVQLGGEEKELTAFFSDIQGFSTFSEKMTPTELVELLNEYLTGMADTIANYEGTVDKYEGDAVIAFFGAPHYFPDHAVRACFACLDQQAILAELRKKWSKEPKWPVVVHDTRVRMGLNTGPMVVGNMGSKGRMNYTMMGDAVNLAARLEGANKPYGTYTMISESTYAAAKALIEVRELDKLIVMGKAKPVTVYELLARKGQVDQKKQDVVGLFLKGLTLFRARNWDEAIANFNKAIQLDPAEAPSKTYIERCKQFKLEPPPDDWDGVFRLTSK